jgi:hypothetical protein
MCVMGARTQMCIEDTVSKAPTNAACTAMCRQMVSKRSCIYHTNVQGIVIASIQPAK